MKEKSLPERIPCIPRRTAFLPAELTLCGKKLGEPWSPVIRTPQWLGDGKRYCPKCLRAWREQEGQAVMSKTLHERAREILKSEPLSDYDRDQLTPKLAQALAEEREKALEEAANHSIFEQHGTADCSDPCCPCDHIQNAIRALKEKRQ